MEKVKKEELFSEIANNVSSSFLSSTTFSPELKQKSLENHLNATSSTTANIEPCLGISSFHHFKLPKSFHLPSGSIFIGLSSNEDELFSSCDDAESKCMEDFSSSPVSMI